MNRKPSLFTLPFLLLCFFLVSACEPKKDQVVFQNKSSYPVTVVVTNKKYDFDEMFTLAPNGVELNYTKSSTDPIQFSYQPIDAVSDSQVKNKIIFQNRN